MALNRGIFCKSLQINHNYLIFLFYHHLVVLIYSSVIGYLIHSMFSGVRGEVLCEKVLAIVAAKAQIGQNILQFPKILTTT